MANGIEKENQIQLLLTKVGQLESKINNSPKNIDEVGEKEKEKISKVPSSRSSDIECKPEAIIIKVEDGKKEDRFSIGTRSRTASNSSTSSYTEEGRNEEIKKHIATLHFKDLLADPNGLESFTIHITKVYQ